MKGGKARPSSPRSNAATQMCCWVVLDIARLLPCSLLLPGCLADAFSFLWTLACRAWGDFLLRAALLGPLAPYLHSLDDASSALLRGNTHDGTKCEAWRIGKVFPPDRGPIHRVVRVYRPSSPFSGSCGSVLPAHKVLPSKDKAAPRVHEAWGAYAASSARFPVQHAWCSPLVQGACRQQPWASMSQQLPPLRAWRRSGTMQGGRPHLHPSFGGW
jgi:hypothetical protein